MAKLNGGQALALALRREGVKTVFGIPGAGQYEAVDALFAESTIRYISVRHEQATSYMADGYARVCDDIAAVLVVPGPGLFNAAAGMATARAASAPMLVVSGSAHHAGPESAELAWMRPLCKWVGQARSPADIPGLVHQAMHQARSDRPQPVAVEIAAQVFAAEEEVPLIAPRAMAQPGADAAAIDETARRLAAAERPVLFVGAGVQRARAWSELQQLAERLQAPVLSGRQGKGALSARHPLSLGYAEWRYRPLADWYARCDLTLAVGTSRDFADWQHPVIRIDAAEQMSVTGVTAIHGDARRALADLNAALADIAHPDRSAEVGALNRARFNPADQLQPQWDLMQAVRRALPDDGILVYGMTQLGYYSRNYFPTYAPRAYLTPSSQITLGSAFPIALGAKVAAPERAVVALCGDGGFLYNAQELATAVQYRIHAVAVVFNDCAYGNVLRAQQRQFGGRVLGTRLHNPDFVALARSFGARGILAADARALEESLRDALAVAAPTVIEVPVGPMEREF